METNSTLNEQLIDDYTQFKVGDIFPLLNKEIHIIILKAKDYLVFLDKELYVHWYYNGDYERDGFAEDYGEQVIREANLEATSILLLKCPQLEVFRRLLGESIGRLLEDRNSSNARKMLDKAEIFLRARSRERARVWYLSATSLATFAMLLIGILMWAYRARVLAFLGLDNSAIEIGLGAVMGSLGALISVLLRSNEIRIDVSAGARVHYFEGMMRVLVGSTAGLLFALAIKANIFLGAINQSERSVTILLVISIIAGASERLLPSLIRQLEGTLVQNVAEVELLTENDLLPEGDPNTEPLPNHMINKTQKKRRSVFFRNRNS